jgi:hypothetical protein
MADGEDAAGEATYVVEEPRRLSASRLWEIQRRYFEQAGVGAWSGGTVPTYVTTNAFIARAYARVVAAYLRDRRQAGYCGAAEPAYIVELGAGSGRLAYHFLKRLAADEAAICWNSGPCTRR